MSSPGTETSSGIGVSPRSSNSLRSSDSLRISTSSGISLEDSERNVSDGSISSSGSDDLRGSRKTGSALDVPARSSWGSSSNEDIPKGGKKIESSLMLHVKRRAKPEFMGFVDAVTLAPAKNPHNRGVRVSNFLVRSSGPHSEEESPYDDLRHHLEKLSSRHGTASLQALLTDTLPQLDYLRDMCAIADCLTAASPTIQKDAASRLERLLLITKYSEMTNATLQLFAVAHKTHDVILTPPTHDDQFLRLCGHLHLLATSALLCHSDRPLTADEWKTLTSWPKPSKKQAGEVVKQSLLKLMHVFYEHFDRHVKDLKSNAAAVRGDRKKFSKGQFCEQFVAVFCVLNEISEHRWNEPGRVLLGELRDLCDIIHKDSRNKPGNEPRTALDLLLVRGLMVLLNTSYAKVRQDVGDGKHDHPRLASELLVKVMERIDKGYHGDVTRDVSKLLFHESPLVTEVINKFLPDSRQSRLNYAFDFTENSLVVADFHVDRSGSSKHDADGGDGNSCAWHPFRGRFGQTLKVEGAVYVHIASCQAKAPHYDCVHGSQSKFSGLQPHERHMETLRQLSYHENLLRLMAYQHIPFGFYATEEVKDRRLLEQLLNHRAAHRWLDKTILCRIALDIVSALEYLASRHIASRDVTAYDMTVFGKSRRGGTSGEVIEVLASDNFIIQLANLGLAHQYRSVDAKSGEVKTVTVTEQGPIPVLWTPREAFLKGEYSDKSMVYSLGAVLYELWTHGGQPFTTQHKSTSDTLKMMLLMPDSVMLIHWPCIPDDVYGLIQRCTTSDPDKRPTLEEVHHDLEAIYQRQIHQDEECYMEAVGVTDQQYPSLMDDQVKRRYVPERGISRELQQLIEEYKRNKFENYKNLRESHQRECPENILMVTESEFYSQEWMDVCYESTGTGACTLVREKVSQTFLEDILPVLREMANAQGGSQLNGVTDWLKDPLNQPTLEQETEDHNVHERRYPVSWVLQEMATRGLLVPNDDDGYVTMGPDRYVSVFVSMARVLHDLHGRGWLHRDLRASNILVDCATGQVIFMRIGRMCQVTPSVESVVGEVFEDTRRWQV
nr:hypothetical protein BaRGS_022514 [Batillaria attramentaria]